MNSCKIQYSPVTEEIVKELGGIVGNKYVIFGDSEKLEPYGHDEIAEKEYSSMPEVLVRPDNAEEISKIIKLANREKIPVTPRGAGSGLSGGAVPVYGGIVLLVDRMNRAIEIDRENMMVVVEPGVVTNEINDLIKEDGLFYAGYPMSLETCFIGGNVAENAGGGKAIKYGVTSRYVTGLEVVTPKGDIIKLGGKLVKDVSGYNILQLMVGSEGTLGIFTKIILKLIPLPKATVDLLVLFESTREAINAVPKIMTESGIIPTAIEFMDKDSFEASCEYLNESIPYKQAGAMLLMTFDGPNTAQVEHEYESVGKMCYDFGAIEVYVADNFTTSERIWKIRRNVAEAFKVQSPHQSLEDIVVPIANIPKMVEGLQQISKEYDIKIPCYGHAGDGNLHATPVMNPQWDYDKWRQTLPDVLADMYKLTYDLEGSLSGEHGIGHKRKKDLLKFADGKYIELMKATKLSFDPNNILNPGKIFDV